ncbi:hypothetical protein QUF64_12580 [Anaerolineales bacterium HSG6]|nr:hypothetical protein [Anaerolineales bacterium HSG6]
MPRITRSRWATFAQFGPLMLTIMAGFMVVSTQLNHAHIIVKWSFLDINASYDLTVQLTSNQLPFLLTLVLLLFVTVIANSPLSSSLLDTGPNSSWFLLGAGASAIFVSAPPLSLSYAILFFDFGVAFYWFRQRQTDVGIARLFLAGLTVLSLLLVTVTPSELLAVYLLTGTIWLRLVLYPLFELHGRVTNSDDDIIYFCISVLVGMYLAINLLNQPLPTSMGWLTILFLLINGGLIWLNSVSDKTTDRLSLIRIVVTLSGLSLLIVPAPLELTIYALTLPLALTTVWLTANLGRVDSSQRWRYIPAGVATISLIGLPSTLGWLTLVTIYDTLSARGMLFLIALMLCMGLSLSYLVIYWQRLWFMPLNETESAPVDSSFTPNMVIGATFVSMVPLLPFVGQTALNQITALIIPNLVVPSTETLVAIGLSWLLAGGAGYYRLDIAQRLKLPLDRLNQILSSHWLVWLMSPLGRLDKFTLQLQVILEGKHYMAWVFFIALVGGLTFLLQS